MRTRDSMICALACAALDHAGKLALAAPPGPPSLITICFKWVIIETRHTHVDPWAAHLARVQGV